MKFEKIDFKKEYESQEEVLNILCNNNNVLYKKLKAEEIYRKLTWLGIIGYFGWLGYSFCKDFKERKDKEKISQVDILNKQLEEQAQLN